MVVEVEVRRANAGLDGRQRVRVVEYPAEYGAFGVLVVRREFVEEFVHFRNP